MTLIEMPYAPVIGHKKITFTRGQDRHKPMTTYTDLDDSALIECIASRDQNALAALYERYSRPVFNIAFYVLQNRVLAEEITQDVFLLIWRYPHKWSPERGQFKSWMLSVTRYSAIDRLRSEQSRSPQTNVSIDDFAEHLEVRISPNALDDREIVRSLLQRLPQEQAQVLMYAFFRGMRHEEIARHLNIPIGTVKSRLRLGLDKLRGWWGEAVDQAQ